jgi:hypothetical protein
MDDDRFIGDVVATGAAIASFVAEISCLKTITIHFQALGLGALTGDSGVCWLGNQFGFDVTDQLLLHLYLFLAASSLVSFYIYLLCICLYDSFLRFTIYF